MKTIDFRNVSVQMTIEGDPVIYDLSKQFGNALHAGTPDIAYMDIAKEIYYKGEVGLTDEQITNIGHLVGNSDFVAPVKVALMNLLTNKPEE